VAPAAGGGGGEVGSHTITDVDEFVKLAVLLPGKPLGTAAAGSACSAGAAGSAAGSAAGNNASSTCAGTTGEDAGSNDGDGDGGGSAAATANVDSNASTLQFDPPAAYPSSVLPELDLIMDGEPDKLKVDEKTEEQLLADYHKVSGTNL
jgi:hypothetical protein